MCTRTFISIKLDGKGIMDIEPSRGQFLNRPGISNHEQMRNIRTTGSAALENFQSLFTANIYQNSIILILFIGYTSGLQHCIKACRSFKMNCPLLTENMNKFMEFLINNVRCYKIPNDDY